MQGESKEPVRETITVQTGGSVSTIIVETDILARIGALIPAALAPRGRLFVVSDEQVWAAHGSYLCEALATAGYEVCSTTIPAGEESKSLDCAAGLYSWLAAARAERGEAIVAFGGGVVGDLVGFVAATYLRGVPLIQVPTSLLAMVDSSVGGKTGVNLPAGKNLVGAFLQPTLVVIDPQLLATLSARERRSGWAEVIKYAFFDGSVPDLTGPSLLPLLQAHGAALQRLEEPICTTVIAQCLRIKAVVVEKDERETGLRRVLNLGHTIGHAIEATAGYGRYTHGEAVALGLRGIARLAVRSEFCTPGLIAVVDQVLDEFGLPAQVEGCRIDALLDRMGSDKKVRAGRVNWVVPTALDRVDIRSDIPADDVRAVLAELGAQ